MLTPKHNYFQTILKKMILNPSNSKR